MLGEQETTEVISTRSYMGTLLLGTLPIVGIILLLIWSKDKNVRESKQNLCKAYLAVKLALIIPLMVIVAVMSYSIGILN